MSDPTPTLQTQQQLIDEIERLRQRIVVLEAATSEKQAQTHDPEASPPVNEYGASDEKLRKAAKNFFTLFHASPVGMSISTVVDGRYIDINNAFLDLHGFKTRDEVIGKTSIALGTWVNVEARQTIIQQLLAAKSIGSFPHQIRTHSGEVRDALGICELIEVEGEDCVLAIIQDITEQKRAVEAFAKERYLFRSVIDMLPDNVFVKDIEGRFILNNKVSLEILGVARQEDVLGKTDFDFMPASQASDSLAHEKALIESGQPIINQEVFQPSMPDKWRWLVYSMIPLRDERGNIFGLAGMTHDITERKRVIERERTIARSLRGVVEAADELIAIQDYNTFYRRAVELAREKLKVDRAGLHLFNQGGQTLRGTYGTDDQGRTTDERNLVTDVVVNDREALQRGGIAWVVDETDRTHWNGEQLNVVETGWVASTLIRIDNEPFGMFYNDAALTKSPVDPVQQEAVALYCSLLGHILKRKRGEDALRKKEQDSWRFQQQLRTLHDVGIELDHAASLDELCRLAVEFGRDRLGFDRIGLFLYESNNTIARATFGTDEYGRTTDDRNVRIPVADYGRDKLAPIAMSGLIERLASGEQALVLHDPTPLLSLTGIKLNDGWSAQAALWDGNKPIGHISADNLLNGQPVGTYQMDLLSLYSITIGQLYTRKLTEAQILALNAELQQHASRLSALNEIARTISSLKDVNSALQNIVHQIKKILPLDSFSVMLTDSEGSVARFPVVYDSGRFWPEEDHPLETTSLEMQVVSTGQPLLINRTEADKRALADSHHLIGDHTKISASLIMAPLPVGNTTIGTVAAHSYTLNTYNSEHLTLLVEAAYQIAIAVENARLYDTLRNELNERQAGEEIIRKLNAELEQRVLDRTAALQEANERLRALSQAKDEFVSNVSHELRTPITSLKIRQYLIRAHHDQLEQHLQVMERETERLHHTIEDLLQLSRLDQRQTEFVLLPLTINVVIESYISDRELTAQAKGLTLAFTAQKGLPSVPSDKGLLEQVLAILLTNAINYTQSGGLITVETLAREIDGKIWVGFCVADTGPGISPTDQPQLFERFFRGTTARTSGVAGTGLGLAIAKEIVDRHGGRIEVESKGVPGEGTRFTVLLPVQSGQITHIAHSM